MENIYSYSNGDIIERWFLRFELVDSGLPLPNKNDFGQESIIINYCLYNKSEFANKLPKDINIEKKESMEKNSIMFDSEGGLPWHVVAGQCSPPLDFPITKKEYEESYALVVWADPFGSTAFFDRGYWKGVPILKGISQFKTEEVNASTKNNIIHIKLKIAQSVISYFIDLVETYTSPSFSELKKIHDAYKSGDKGSLGKLGVMSISIDKNNGSIDKFGNNLGEKIFGESGTDLYDDSYWLFEQARAKNPSHIQWGDTNISIYDFKAPIKKLYGEVMRIGNDSRIYSNEGFSNLNWGIVGYQLELGPERMIQFSHMDPTSGNQDHDDSATRDGQRAGENASVPQSNDPTIPDEFPRPLDRRKLFLYVTKVLSENDLYTYLGVLKHLQEVEELRNKAIIESLEKFNTRGYLEY